MYGRSLPGHSKIDSVSITTDTRMTPLNAMFSRVCRYSTTPAERVVP